MGQAHLLDPESSKREWGLIKFQDLGRIPPAPKLAQLLIAVVLFQLLLGTQRVVVILK